MEVQFNLKTFKNISLNELKTALSGGFCTNIILVKKGTLFYSSENEDYSVTENQVLTLPPYTDFSLKRTQKKDLTVSVFSYFINSEVMPMPHLPIATTYDSFTPISQELNNYFNLKENENYKNSLLKKSLEYKIIYLSENSAKNNEEYINNKIQPLISFIHKNLSQNFTVKDMAKECNLSEASVYKIFDDYIKMPPKQFIRNQRMKYALHLLLDTNMSISEISYESGFYDQYYFSKEFKKTFSLSPSLYRKNNKKK